MTTIIICLCIVIVISVTIMAILLYNFMQLLSTLNKRLILAKKLLNEVVIQYQKNNKGIIGETLIKYIVNFLIAF